MKILLLEDDEAQAAQLVDWMVDAGHSAEHVLTCADFFPTLERVNPDLIVLDWELPDGSGFDILLSLRSRRDRASPVLFTTQRDSESDIVAALEGGADDYLCKPVRKAEFVARLNALGRRTGVDTAPTRFSEGPFEFDIEGVAVTVHGELKKTTQKDFALALCLFQHIGRALSRDFLLQHVWGVAAELDTRTVDMHISRIRRGLGVNVENGYVIKTIYQYGYRLERVAKETPDGSTGESNA